MDSVILVAFQAFLLLWTCSSGASDHGSTYDELYSAGVEAYMASKWSDCSNLMEKALEDYRSHQDNLLDCRLQCKDESTTDTSKEKDLELAFFHLAIKRSNCIRKCKSGKSHFRTHSAVHFRPEVIDENISKAFEELEPYNYLQICAYYSGKYELAASSAHTYLQAHPNHGDMRRNIELYRSMPEMKPAYFTNKEPRPHQDYYTKGVEAYNDGDWQQVVLYIEEALQQYYQAMQRCHLGCEKDFQHQGAPELYNAIADHYISTLECKMQCPSKLATLGGKEIRDYFAEHFNYLQFAYYKLNDVNKACQCVATYLMLKPGNDVMMSNKRLYLAQTGVEQDDFVVRESAEKYHTLQAQMKRMLNYVHKSYNFDDVFTEISAEQEEMIIKEKVPEEYLQMRSRPPVYLPLDNVWKSKMAASGAHVTMQDGDLGGKHRVVVDNFLSQEQCDQMIRLADLGATQGDGYQGSEQKSSPFTNHETFKGLTVQGSVDLVAAGVVPGMLSQLYLNTTDVAVQYLNDYYNLEKPMYFHFTHLVKRTAHEDQSRRNQDDLSHPVHSDNCNVQGDGTCLPVRPHLIPRDFSAIVYLNEDMVGGEFFFAHKNQSVHTQVKPRCGRMVAFPANHFHGVRALQSGNRYAVALWFTLNFMRQETSRAEALVHLRMLESADSKVIENPELKLLIEEKKMDIMATEDELNGPERFAADNLATQEECDTLIELANEGGLKGDGYFDDSPHTSHENFKGVTVLRAAEVMQLGMPVLYVIKAQCFCMIE